MTMSPALRQVLGRWIDETGAFRHDSVIAVMVLKLSAAHDEYTRRGIALGTNGHRFGDGFTSHRCIDVSRCRWLVRGWRRNARAGQDQPPRGNVRQGHEEKELWKEVRVESQPLLEEARRRARGNHDQVKASRKHASMH